MPSLCCKWVYQAMWAGKYTGLGKRRNTSPRTLSYEPKEKEEDTQPEYLNVERVFITKL